MRAASLFCLVSLLAFASGLWSAGQDARHAALDSPYGTYADTGLPFFCQTLDARELGANWPQRNLTPRGIVIDLGAGYHACFDPDLLRIALVWRENDDGSYLTMNGMAPGSYRQPHRKAPAGQGSLPTPIGEPVLANGLYPGVQSGDPLLYADPRESSVDKEETGLGPLPRAMGRWRGLRLDEDGPVLSYEVGGTRIEEQLSVAPSADKTPDSLIRTLRVDSHLEPLTFLLPPASPVTLPPASKSTRWKLIYELDSAPEGNLERIDSLSDSPAAPSRFWNGEVRVPMPAPSATDAPFVRDEIPLPLPNPWKRNVRPSDFDFFPDGRLALVTFDGDVWIADGVTRDQEAIVWRRFAAGLHEPMGLRIVEGHIVVFDRNGLVRLIDRDQNGEADIYENLSSIAAQTAETREFAMGLERKPEGGFYLSKGGQVASTRGKYNGTILEISSDGSHLEVVATGLRQPFIGVDPESGLLTASDQQGHWIPSTPLHVVEPGSYYGFQPRRLGADANEGRSITEPPIWIPHFVNQSGARQVWLRGAKMGALNDSLIHIGYNRPALFKVFLQKDARQGAVAPLMEDFPTGLLAGRVNPSDGRLYVGGLNLWGTVGKQVQGLFRIRPTDRTAWIPREISSYTEGVYLQFDQPVDPATASQIGSYTIDRWNYQRSQNYGSGHFKLDGTPGQEPLAVASVYLSNDARGVFLGIPDMQPVHSLRLIYQVQSDQPRTAYLTVNQLKPVDLDGLGFEQSEVDLSPAKTPVARDLPPPSAADGAKLAATYGCFGCHSSDGSKKTAEDPALVVGPSWSGLYGSSREFTDGSTLDRADEAYLRESILEPARHVTKGFETGRTGVGMPSYRGVLRNDQVSSLVLYIKSLAE